MSTTGNKKPRKKNTQAKTVKAMAEKASILTDDGKLVVMLKYNTQVEIYKCRAKNVGRVMDFVAFIMEEMGIENFGAMPTGVNFTDPKMILPLLTKSASRIIYLSADLCDMEVEDVENLELDDMIKLVTAQFEVNKDFFLKNVLPSARIDLKG